MRLSNYTLSPTRINSAKAEDKLYKLSDGGRPSRASRGRAFGRRALRTKSTCCPPIRWSRWFFAD